VTLIIDTAPLVALADRRDRMGPMVKDVLEQEPGRLVIPAPVSAEVDYLLGQRLGRTARLSFLRDVVAGRFAVECLEPVDYGTVTALEDRYAELDAGLADLSVVVLAARHRTRRLLTFDEQDFRTLRPLTGGTFVLLPGDASGR